MEDQDKLVLVEPAAPIWHPRQIEAHESIAVSERRTGPYLRAVWRVVQKRRWTIFSAVLIIFTATLIATVKETPIYRARALLEIEKENPNILTVQELFQLENVSDNYLESQYKILQSESVARRVIAQLQLDRVREFNPLPGWWRRGKDQEGEDRAATTLTPDSRQTVLQRFASRLTIEPVRQSRLVEVSFESQDRELAAKIVNAVTASYIEENLQNRWDATEKATEWLSQQLEGLKIKLEKSEDELQHYAQTKGLLFLESGQGKTENITDERLRQLQEELTKAQAERYQKESLYRLVQAGDYGSLPGIADNKLMDELTMRLSDLEASYAQLATTFSPDYPKVKQVQSQISETQRTLERERKRIAGRMTNEYAAAVRREALVDQAFREQQKLANEATARAVQYSILKREVDTNKQLYDGLLQRLKEASVSAGLKASNIRIIDAAVPPVSPVKPRVTLNLALALLLGLSGGIGLAFLQEHLDNTLKTSEDVERFLELPALAAIPAYESLNGHRHRVYGLANRGKLREKDENNGALKPSRFRIDELEAQYSVLPEAFRSLRTSVLLSTANRPPRSLLITSAEPAEGKTTVAINLAVSLAQLGKRVLIIDGDMRRPFVHKLFGIENARGLVSYLTGQQDWRALVHPAGPSDLDCLPCGPVPPNPAELLSSERMQTLVREAVNEYQFVLVDSPPLLNVADGRILATMVEGAVLVVKGGGTPRESVQRAQFYIRGVGAHLIGVVLNNVDLRHDGYYYSYYHYRYYGGAEDAQEREKEKC